MSETFLNETAELIECFSCGRRRLIFTLHALHADQWIVKSPFCPMYRLSLYINDIFYDKTTAITPLHPQY